MEKVIVTTRKATLRGQSMTCAAGTIDFNEVGEAEITFEQAELLRNVKHLSFSDREEAVGDAEIIEETQDTPEMAILETQNMPMNFGMPEGLETEVVEEEVEEEVKEEETPTEKEDDTDEKEDSLVEELNGLKIGELKEICEAADVDGYKSLKKAELVDFIIKNDLIK